MSALLPSHDRLRPVWPPRRSRHRASHPHRRRSPPTRHAAPSAAGGRMGRRGRHGGGSGGDPDRGSDRTAPVVVPASTTRATHVPSRASPSAAPCPCPGGARRPSVTAPGRSASTSSPVHTPRSAVRTAGYALRAAVTGGDIAASTVESGPGHGRADRGQPATSRRRAAPPGGGRPERPRQRTHRHLRVEAARPLTVAAGCGGGRHRDVDGRRVCRGVGREDVDLHGLHLARPGPGATGRAGPPRTASLERRRGAPVPAPRPG